MAKVLFFTLVFFLVYCNISSNSANSLTNDPEILDDCTFNGFPLYGDVQVVDAFPDIKVQVVNAFPDLKVTVVEAFPDDCGEWKFVTAFPDVTIQFVDAFPDVKIQFVDAFPGLP